MNDVGPILVVAAAIVRDSQVMLAQRYQPELPEAHLRWELPGGKVKFGEGLHDALKREILEELGTKIVIVRMLPHVQSTIYCTNGGAVHAVVIAFECSLVLQTSEPYAADASVQSIVWIYKEGLKEFDSLPGVIAWLECLEDLGDI